MKLTSRTVTAAFLVAVLACTVAADGADRLFLWKARSSTNTVYLLGSIHVANESFYPMPPEVEKAFGEAKVLAVEVDLTKVDASAMQEALLAKGTYEGEDSLGNHVPPQTLKKVRAYFAGKGMRAAAMEKFRPWALSVTITMLEMKALGYQTELGIDKHFMERAGGKKVVELESADEQIKLLSGFPEKLEAEFLASTLDSTDKAKTLMAELVGAWKSGDVAALEKLLITGPLAERPELKDIYAKLFDERNEKMARKIGTFLKAKEPHFVVVGAGHLIGQKGIVQLLEKQGFSVEQVTGSGEIVKAAPGDAAAGASPVDGKPAAAAPGGGTKPLKRGYAPADAWKK